MATVYDTAAYILNSLGPMTAMKLQKLVYYAQAWSLVWDDKPLFEEPIQAWVNGPVCPALYACHRGKFEVSGILGGQIENLTGIQKESIDAVMQAYGQRTSQWLSDLTHSELPWKDARRGLAPDERGSSVIGLDSMVEYYGSLTA